MGDRDGSEKEGREGPAAGGCWTPLTTKPRRESSEQATDRPIYRIINNRTSLLEQASKRASWGNLGATSHSENPFKYHALFPIVERVLHTKSAYSATICIMMCKTL